MPPARLEERELVAWLVKTAAARGIDTTSLEALERAASARPRDLAALPARRGARVDPSMVAGTR